jgi:hypothetical protein
MLAHLFTLFLAFSLALAQDNTRCPQASGLVVSGSLSFSRTPSTPTQTIPASS